jgi:hypothetical protein
MLTPRLVPWTMVRWLVLPLSLGAAAVVAWWAAGLWLVHTQGQAGPQGLTPDQVQVRVLAGLAAVISAGSVVVEGRIGRSPVGRRVWAGLLAALVAGLAGWALGSLVMWVQRAAGMPEVTLALRWRLGPWLAAGLAVGWGGLAVRVGRQGVDRLQARWDLPLLTPPPVVDEGAAATWAIHVIGAPAAAGAGAVVWYALGELWHDLFLASAAGAWTFGAVWGALGSGWPERLVQAWVSVAAGARPGWRVPLDASDPVLSERFIGSFPAGLDLHLPESDGVAELHLSVRAIAGGGLAARGLSVRPVRLARRLERVDLRYDPTLPAPFETPVGHEDRIRLGERAEIEVVVLSREGMP